MRRGAVAIIGGCGHVGLPLGLALARAGVRVTAVDIDASKVAQANEGVMPFTDHGAAELLPRVLEAGTLVCTTDRSSIAEAEVVITVIGTPLDDHLNPRFDIYRDLLKTERPHLRPGQLVVLRSTVYPGTTDRLAAVCRSEGLGIDLAFCPERVAEGLALQEIGSLPQIVAGTTPAAQSRAEELFRLITPEIVRLSPLSAELAKLFTNAWRYIQFAAANQFFMIANESGVDFQEIRHAMTYSYPRAKDLPQAGFAAGPCLLKDTMQLSAYHNNSLFLGHAAMLVNEGLPNYLVRRAAARFELRKAVPTILGMAFKKDSDDPRDSLAFKLRKVLEIECQEVLCSDPFVKDPSFVSLDEALARGTLFFIGAPHSIYREISFGGRPVIDVWRHTRHGLSLI